MEVMYRNNIQYYYDGIPLPSDGLIYHYTDIVSLKSIIDSKELWASNCRYLNDKAEMRTIERIIQETPNELKNSLKAVLDKLIKKNESEYNNIFILSFSGNSDSLMLWSNYSNNDGFSIGFDYSCIYQHVADKKNIKILSNNSKGRKTKTIDSKHFKISILPVLYDKQWQLDYITYLIDQTSYQLDTKKNLLKIFNQMCKMPLFAQEEEYRLIITIPEEIKEEVICYRTAKNTIMPYIRLDFSFGASGLPLKKITSGPKNHNDTVIDGVRTYLENNKYKDCSVVRSEIPLR